MNLRTFYIQLDKAKKCSSSKRDIDNLLESKKNRESKNRKRLIRKKSKVITKDEFFRL